MEATTRVAEFRLVVEEMLGAGRATTNTGCACDFSIDEAYGVGGHTKTAGSSLELVYSVLSLLQKTIGCDNDAQGHGVTGCY